jgi:hypothetical protein
MKTKMKDGPEVRAGVRASSDQGRDADIQTWRRPKTRVRIEHLHWCRNPAHRKTRMMRKDLGRNAMNRLPTYDHRTRRAESGAFLGLSLMAIALIIITTLDAARFTSERDEKPPGLSRQSTTAAETKQKNGLTNLTIFQPGTPADRARVNGFGEPKS